MALTLFGNDGDNSRTAEAAALREAVRRLAPEARFARIAVRDVVAMVGYHLNSGEHARRGAAGLLAVTDLEMLDALLNLPSDLPVPMDALGTHVRQVIGRLPVGCVQVAGRMVTRHIVRPLRVDLAVVTAESEDWRAGLRKAGKFSTYCTRLLVIGDTPDDLVEAQAEAACYGIGLVVDASSTPVTAVAPEGFSATAHTAAGWRFTEQAYSEVVSRGLV